MLLTLKFVCLSLPFFKKHLGSVGFVVDCDAKIKDDWPVEDDSDGGDDAEYGEDGQDR